MEEQEITIRENNPLQIKEPRQLKVVKAILYGRFWGWKGWELFLTQKRLVDAKADNVYDLERKKWELVIKQTEVDFIDALQKADQVIDYKNMFWVLKKVVNKITQDGESHSDQVDIDKVKKLKDLSKAFSSEDMQELIAWILAWEYNKPWTFSLHTISIVKNLSKWELNIFEKFCWLVIEWEYILVSFYDLANWALDRRIDEWFDWNDLLYLQDLWLVSRTESGQRYAKFDGIYPLSLVGHNIYIKWEGERNMNRKLFLSKAWQELYKIINPIFNDKVHAWIIDELKKQWFEITKNDALDT